MEIRKPDEMEQEQIISLSPQAIADGTLGEVKPTNEKVRQLTEPLLKKGCYYLAAYENNELLGWILAGPSKDQFTDQPIGFIYELFVREEFRGKGISKRLMSVAIDRLKETGYPEIRLSAFEGNPAIRLYEKMGFHARNVTMSLQIK
ncbi:GNAT family N-acetyltransferase [Sporosarcina cascadiensis]|uniref:GNAT family N-acetyltransferase n=1 Tax=Sporosarcina cascadiensis TaxID=2660747 RepID=UPI00129BEAD1|nr:GNAT family N-acetyltransferase [Sporosarcina cascadiensis]